ncbi:kinesin [Cylindrobasidium torrendii FP15055 ss-10]|uniref:Kinesin n=1 Tax=Cylindrobasidium torrendii FP15055 ss-10 TaxID=1314674 RepID=A0A0D7AV05_9AGAR|nr:kinesin [Cylindrobasidium torrendii FP15055 ss-10]
MAPPPSSSATTSVQVAVRIRPTTTQDNANIPARFQRSVLNTPSATTVTVDATSGAAVGGNSPAAASSSGAAAKKQQFTFDQVHGPATQQHTMFTSTAEPLVARFVEGFNCTILAYGQTSSGKTHTMTGVDLDADPSDPNNGMGIIPRAVSTIFTRCRQLREERAGAWNYSLKGSFIEIYNEDLIDLLGMDDGGGRREVQIREDKDGHIIWGGLREVNVKNPTEVMGLIRKGTSIRRTNETDMNAQSSRSHAIFSLTLTQKKFTGSGAPPRSSSPLPPNGRSPSRLARPGSMYQNGPSGTRVASPTNGRPSTPSFASAMGRGGLRPSSALGHTQDRSVDVNEDSGEWITITSKFHFVDLAGSERLKRTAAVGDRAKEGISINGGLLALGNVISALGDPARSRSGVATHIPYRDSKLTRLLQDSLGGNAHTLMIACVSSAEYNAGETINTLKYANRARNIKNRAVVNEKEDGWDDVEWLQGMVTRLRKEVKSIKDGGLPAGDSNTPSEPIEGAGKKVLAQMTELQSNYEELREKFTERTQELTRLRRELGEKQSSAPAGTAKYEEIVGPVIEEYEKTISAMEAELSLNRAALRHTNEMVEEKEDELAAVTERHAATELYVEELRARVAKLTEREASTEAYVRDLEEKMKSYDESSITSSESLTDLKREVARFRGSESHSAKYIAELEARLGRADQNVLQLQQTVDRLEKDVERRRDEVEVLQSRLETLRTDGEGWRTDLEERERRVKELEEKMREWEQKRQEAGATRERLGHVVEEVASARRSLEIDLNSAPTPPATAPSSPARRTAELPDLNEHNSGAIIVTTEASSAENVRSQFRALQETHTATLADLSSITSKYRDALREISDLAAQIQEAKLNNDAALDSPSTEPIELLPPTTPTMKRRVPSANRLRETPEPQFNAAGKRLFFRQAASAESLHSRSLSQSQSLSQELSSVHSRKTSFSSASSHSRSESNSTFSGSRPNLSISLPNHHNERSVSSLEKEIMRLQEVLRERETEIQSLEVSLKQSQDDRSVTSSPFVVTPADLPTPINTKNDERVNGAAHLSPKTISNFDHIRRSMEITGNGIIDLNSDFESDRNESVISESDESLERLNELMLSMAQKESQHRELVEGLNSQLTQVKRQHDDLTALARDQAMNMSAELESLQRRNDADAKELDALRQREHDLIAQLEKVNADHTATIEALKIEHAEAMQSKEKDLAALALRLKEDHGGSVAVLQDELSAATAALETLKRDHETAFGKLQSDHEAELATTLEEAATSLSQVKDDHASTVRKLIAEHEENVKVKGAEADAILHKTEEDYYNVLTKLRGDHAAALEKHSADHAAALERLKEEHIAEVRMSELSRQGSLVESASAQDIAMQNLQEEHLAAIARKESAYADETVRLQEEHNHALTTREEDFKLELDKVRSEHEGVVMRLKEEWRAEGERLNMMLVELKEQAAKDLSLAHSKAKSDLEAALLDVKQQHAAVLEDMGRVNEEESTVLKASHQTALAEAEGKLQSLTQAHTEEMLKLKADHQLAVTELNNSLTAAGEEHRAALEGLRSGNSQILAEEQQRTEALIADLNSQHQAELETIRKDRELLAEELQTHKATVQQHELAVAESSQSLSGLQTRVAGVEGERDELAEEVAALRAELDRTRNEQSQLLTEASKRESLVGEIERHRSILAEIQENLQKVKDEKDNLQVEKNRSDSMLKELQAQLSRTASPPPLGRAPNDRSVSYTRQNGMSPMKLPPPAPPPSAPPPPAPRGHEVGPSISSSSGMTSSTSSRESQLDSPATSVTPTSVLNSSPETVKKIEAQAKQIDEQETMIKTLNKQLTHCESDLQTHMDLVSTLETSLGDSEKNLRKARMHATELARERDTLNVKLEGMRAELDSAKKEVVNVRQSIVQEKQSYEQRLDEERRAKERARQQLDSRMEELTTKRKSKFACL